MTRVFSGVQPTGRDGPHIGNYIGAFRQWVPLQDEHESFICVVDLHSMTVPWDPAEVRNGSRNLVAMLLACGIDPAKTVLFLQSDVRAHTELAWILGCVSRMGELSRMTQFKDKSRGKDAGSIGVGLFLYPVLMAADVLAYRADLVPVGDDQRQHLELMRDLAQRFNRHFGETFPLPKAFYAEHGARVMSLDDPTQKMSKSSDRPSGQIWMLDPPEAVRSKVSKAVTDSGREIEYSPEKPALSNLLGIFSGVTGRPIPELEASYSGSGYAVFKSDLADAVIEFLRPYQTRYADISADIVALDRVLDMGAERALSVADDTMKQVRERIGLRP